MDRILEKEVFYTPFIICTLASFFYFYDYFIQVSPAVITHQLMASFNIGAAGLGILSSSFFYTYTLMQIPAGSLLDKYGARKLLSLAILISGTGVLLFSITHSFFIANISRLLVGAGSAFSFVGALFLAARWVPNRYFPIVAGLVQLSGTLGSIVGETPLAAAVNHFGWRDTMSMIAIITFIIALLFWLVIRDKNSQQTFHDHQAPKLGALDALKQVIKNKQIIWVALIGFVCWTPVATIGALWGVPYLMRIYHIANTEAAMYISIFWVTLGAMSPLAGWYSEKIKRRKTAFYICFITGASGAILFILAPTLPKSITLLALCLIGFCPAIQALTFAIVKDITPKQMFGTASGLINMAPIIGGALAQMSIGFLLSSLWNKALSHGVPVYPIHAYQIGFMILIAANLLGLLVTHFKLKESYGA